MSRRHRAEDPVLSLDSFLDIVTNVVGVLILVAVVTVLGTGDIGVSAGTSALTAPQPLAERVVFECSGNQLYFIDEDGLAEKVKDRVETNLQERGITADTVMAFLDDNDVGNRTHRVKAEVRLDGLAWLYALRSGARGESVESLDQILGSSTFHRKLAELPPDGFVYFVVHDDSFEVFRKARAIARSMGVAVGWHPVEGNRAIRMSMMGSLGKRTQ